jgi:hypothetical protein
LSKLCATSPKAALGLKNQIQAWFNWEGSKKARHDIHHAFNPIVVKLSAKWSQAAVWGRLVADSLPSLCKEIRHDFCHGFGRTRLASILL